MYSAIQKPDETFLEEEGSSDDDEGSEDEKIGTQAWQEQQERRRNRYRIAVDVNTPIYDIEAVRRKRIEQERVAREFEEQERIRVEEEEAAMSGYSSGGMEQSRSTEMRNMQSQSNKQQRERMSKTQQMTTTTTTTSTTKRSSAAHHSSSSSRHEEGGYSEEYYEESGGGGMTEQRGFERGKSDRLKKLGDGIDEGWKNKFGGASTHALAEDSTLGKGKRGKK